MISLKKIKEIREALLDSSNPLFFFDNDQDGLCSFLILRRFLDRGKGVPVKGVPLSEDYFKRVREFNPDKIFILDVPEVSEKFFEKVKEINIPVFWIDHHQIDKNLISNYANYYNSYSKKNLFGEPVTFICYQITRKKTDLWLGVAGCISDKFIPNFYRDFLKLYPDLGIDTKNAFEIFYNSEIGKVARIFGAGLKDRTTNVMHMIRFVLNSSSPYDILNASGNSYEFYKRFQELETKLNLFIERAKSNSSEKILFLKYSGETSMSADISNKLSYLFPNKIIVVAYLKGDRVNISLRGKNLKPRVLKIIENIENARGGGHEEALGIQIRKEDLDFFIEELKRIF